MSLLKNSTYQETSYHTFAKSCDNNDDDQRQEDPYLHSIIPTDLYPKSKNPIPAKLSSRYKLSYCYWLHTIPTG